MVTAAIVVTGAIGAIAKTANCRRPRFLQGVSHTTQPSDNLCVLTACIAEREALRYTPAGLPALNLKLEHESEVQEAGQARQVKVAMKSVAFAAVAERLVNQALGSQWRFKGFLASQRNGKGVVFHIQEFSQD